MLKSLSSFVRLVPKLNVYQKLNPICSIGLKSILPNESTLKILSNNQNLLFIVNRDYSAKKSKGKGILFRKIIYKN